MSHMIELRCSSMPTTLDADYFRMFSSRAENGFVRLKQPHEIATAGSGFDLPRRCRHEASDHLALFRLRGSRKLVTRFQRGVEAACGVPFAALAAPRATGSQSSTARSSRRNLALRLEPNAYVHFHTVFEGIAFRAGRNVICCRAGGAARWGCTSARVAVGFGH